MALRDLVEGDCGGPSSVARLASHYVQDHGFVEEGIGRPFVPSTSFEASDSDHLVKQFLEETVTHPQTFRMDSLLQEMRQIDHNIHAPVPAPGVIKELTGQDTAWANQYLESGRHFDEQHADAIWNTPAEAIIPHSETFELGLGPKWAEEYLEHSVDNVEKDVNQNGFVVKSTEALDNDDPNFAYSKFMKFMRQEGEIPIDPGQTSLPNLEKLDDKWTEEFSSMNISASERSGDVQDEHPVLSKIDEELAAAGTWAEEFSTENSETQDADDYKSNFWTRLQDEWEKISASDEVSTSHPWLSEYEKYYDPFQEYTFTEENVMKDIPNALEEGKKRLEAGDLPSAVLCFEAAVQQEKDNSDAWLLLGKTQAENEQDPLAISALKHCLSLDPTNSVAMMTLAVSYTNESYQNQACITLKEWLMKNEKYKNLTFLNKGSVTNQRSKVSTILSEDSHEEVKQLFIEAARMNPTNEIDADVQCGLGVLFNISNEFDKAVDCFKAALHVKPDDSRLWNRLGATLANGQRSEEAIEAYHNALRISPGFIRARYNLGISCINLSAYKEAGEHLLTALNQQAVGRDAQGQRSHLGTMSDSIWSTLRLVVSLMHKYHLSDAIEERDLATLNKEFEMD
ncbi:peroxisomal targeting signal 1 receptor isoform X1 [Neodiprion virginianus]|uniref:peroxisomal targeting signal 1 receptor isoform X1 n=1 Tax=Neodiprion fabricii TaxID=2872261 RepID=UPI001ED903EB|nr:peroxisomal targeting signal 1 receptor isoform X1 [Neodiprion fabricii]XP_046416642.1 peroxisomal targeting signal 1 receptor isoform X1 [Neodiprion fabricii]XP_046612472.1 peroxisomal targeting signal 1 receptor isoform X1 [Neodiprion virginianus]XP_046612473.1 peroxisomal targeting signal 1 receptor isoform X1 [Neodiprion virginianus]